eukprot:250628-Amorphochlora_amoeboformis.AAC.1
MDTINMRRRCSMTKYLPNVFWRSLDIVDIEEDISPSINGTNRYYPVLFDSNRFRTIRQQGATHTISHSTFHPKLFSATK